MMVIFIILVVAGAGSAVTTPSREQKGGGPIAPIRCGPNSHFEKCSKICPPQNCSYLQDPHWFCEDPGCKPECRCNDGFYRNQNGICISRAECLAQCGPLERHVADSSDCQRTCANYKVTGPRSLCKPYTGCVCEEGLVRLNDDATGPCVLPKDCPTHQCPLREHWEACPSVCANETCISKSPNYKCLLPAIPLPCKGRCMCDKGYLRNEFGDCIPENHCTIKECPINEEWRCASMCSRDSCKFLEPDYQCAPGIISVCIPACTCKGGFLRNDNGICVPRELCPASLRCGINEVAVECQAYPPQTCESVYTLYGPIEDPRCVPGCDCRDGYLRNKHNICVPSEFCPAVPNCLCGPNQEYKECGSSCAPSCSDLDNPPQVCPAVCVKGCFCKDGYLKDDRGNCVTRSQCPPPICNQPNEVAKECGSYCEMRTCEDYNRTDIVCPAVCVRGCFCRDGYVKNANGICIRKEKCPPNPVCLQENEEYQSCGSSCPDNCDNYLNPDRICTQQCVAGCNCKAGYVRNLKDGTCIKPEQCPSKDCTGLNEDLNSCASYCPVTCANRYTQGDWACITLCREACDCIPGTLRNDTGACVPVDQCTPPICRENEKYMNCGTACPITCDNYKNPPTICTEQCIEDCFCIEGYVRNRFGRCVKPEECEPTCPAGEKWNECSAHCQDTCENYMSSNRVCTYQCQSGCVCEQGTVRRKDGQCVRPTECTEPITCPVGEVYDPCSAHCEPTCEHHGPDRVCTAICIPGCRCGEGLVRRKDGRCVKLTQCLHTSITTFATGVPYNTRPTSNTGSTADQHATGSTSGRSNTYSSSVPNSCGPNQEYKECGSSCPPSCSDLDNPSQVCPAVCVKGCFCKDGYLKDDRGNCVIRCPPPICDKPNEIAKECGSYCEIRTCEDYNRTDIGCPAVCVRGCFCRDGYVRNADGVCIPKEECLPNSCGPNQEYKECGSSCPPSCSDLDNPQQVCPAVCVEGCFCKDGYLKDDRGNCVTRSQCPLPICDKPNEVAKECGSYCEIRTCEDYNRTDIVCPAVCVRGCFCRDGHVRNANGVCIPKEECPPNPVCLQENEEYQSCGSSCPDNCNNYMNPDRICTQQCVAGCTCKAGYVRNLKDGTCIKPEQCRSTGGLSTTSSSSSDDDECPSNEVYDPCIMPPCPPGRGCIQVCQPGCRCKNGLVRDNNGKCVVADATTRSKRDTDTTNDQQATGSNGSLPPTSSSSSDDDQCPSNEVYDPCITPPCSPGRGCIQVCQPGCRCKNGLVRDKNGKCVNLNCPKNERWVDCVLGLCIPLSCDQLGFPIACPDIIGSCDGGCVCAENYVRDSNNVCIPKQNCPSCNNDFNATSGCGIHCGRQCTDYKNHPNCAIPMPCQYNGCDCKKGYVYDVVTDQCVNPVDCPVPCNGDIYAEKVQCPNPCPATCAKPTTAVCTKNCLKEGCQCRVGYVLGPNGKCVKPENCPDNLGCNGDPNSQIGSCVTLCQPVCGGGPKFCPALCRLGCACKSGYILSEVDGICIKPDKCVNATTTTTTTEAPSTTRTTYSTNTNSNDQQPTGGQQSTNSSTSALILCPKDEIWIDCKAGYCQPEYCRDIDKVMDCPQVADPCPGGCICREGLLRNEDGSCIPKNECPINTPCTDPNAITKKCASHESCRATCAEPNPKVCPKICIVNGCECKKGYVLSKSKGQCIRIEDCPKGNVSCNGDPNAQIMAFPPPCPSTCNMPNGITGCLQIGSDVGCQCKPGYLKGDGGKCILPDNCEGGNPCGTNATFSWCKVNCPNNYCPVDDSRGIIACDPPYPCPSGCVCKLNHRRKSRKDDRCILASDCPPVKCTRPNEVWDSCPSACLRERCEDVNDQPTTCNTLVLNCSPQCICKKGYFRNASDICIRAKDCKISTAITQPCADPNAERVECAPAPSCRSTCATPNPSPCIQSCAVNECVCKNGYVLSKKGGKCIPVDQCPKDVPCNGDSNAVIIANPPPCPSTCDTPNASYLCRNVAPPVACQCKDGFIKASYDGKCIKPDKCPGGNPCGPNSTYVSCNSRCPTGYCPVNDHPVHTPCELPYPCPSGCTCKINYKRKSVNDNTCILASTCPPVNCTRPNEVWDPCASACLAESCADVNKQPTTCNTLVLNCQPQCVCKKGYFRNSTISNGFSKDTCIPEKDCPQNKPCEDPNAERMECAPAPSCRATCATRNPSPCIEICALNQCVCKKGYVLSTKGGKCIPVNQCPTNNQCSDPNSERVECALAPECRPTCANPKPAPCISQICIKNECVCKQGYVLSEKGGKCVPLNKCPTQIQCKANEVYSSCRINCPPQTCASIYTSYSCQIPAVCEPGCDCISGYLRNGTVNDPCIPSSQCPTSPPVIPECGINEHYETNSNKCDLTCKNYHMEPVIGQCQTTSACVCDDGYVRNTNGLCIPKKRCPQNIICPRNEVVSECYNSCHTTCKTRLRGDGRVCQLACIETGCLCKEGYLRHDNGTCVPISQCSPPRCNDDEVYTKCGSACPLTCEKRGDNCTVCTKQCVEGCFCKKGLVRSDDGSCVKPKDCPPRICGDNEKFDHCPPTCPPTDGCSNLWSKFNCTDAIQCCKPQCRCKSGYFRKDNVCVPTNQCLN